jgi:hypothetical protein
MRLRHRKRIKHYEEQQVRELTFSCFELRRLLTTDLWRTWSCEVLGGECERPRFLLLVGRSLFLEQCLQGGLIKRIMARFQLNQPFFSLLPGFG